MPWARVLVAWALVMAAETLHGVVRTLGTDADRWRLPCETAWRGDRLSADPEATDRPAVRGVRPTNLVISRSHSTELAMAIQNSQSRALKLTVPNAR